jgi:predicted alpha/beta hydrolase family esterase
MRIAETDILLVPGANRGPDHWMSRWRQRMPTARIVDGSPGSLVQLSRGATRPVVLIAHGDGVIDVAGHAPLLPPAVRGAFLVAPRDSEEPAQEQRRGPEGNGLTARLPFPSILVASRNDPACAFERARQFADAWGSLFLDAGDAGGLDAASGHGPWPEGLLLFSRLLRNLSAPPLAH